MNNEKIFITGGAGFLGAHLVKRYYKNNSITVYSRDESKHYYLKKRFPNIKCVIGDIRNYDLLLNASKNCTIGIFAASLKQISAVDQNVEESIRILIDGAVNSRKVCENNKFKAGCFISSDKSRAATTLYGSMKFIAGELFIVNSENSYTKLSTVIYGNVMNSTGSIIPLIWDAIKNDYELTLYSSEMTRFMITIDNAINLIELALCNNGYNLIPNLKSFLVKDLFEIYSTFGLKYKTGKPRISEKLHEVMIAEEEVPRTAYHFAVDTYYMHYKQLAIKPIKKGLVSSDTVIPKKDLNDYLAIRNYFKP